MNSRGANWHFQLGVALAVFLFASGVLLLCMVSIFVVENNNIALIPIRADITKTIISVTPLRFNVNHPIPLR